MAKLDGNTLTEYFAAGDTAALRAQAVVDALNTAAGSPMEVTVNIRTGGSPDEIVATGTLMVPWATQASGVITLGEVQSPLTVTQSGTPDANWYLEFAAGSRYVWGTFGLSSSDAEFKWSLPTFEAGQTATLGSVAFSAVSNSAPTFTVAPTTASLGSGGGTIQFTATDADGDPLTYSLPTTRTGITINSATGLVTVTSAAAGTSGNIVVRASDGNLSVDSSPCSVTVAALSGSDTPDYVDPVLNVTRVNQTTVNVSTTAALQTAINNATAGTTIQLAAGTYAGNVTLSKSFDAEDALIIKGAPAFGSIVTGYWLMTGDRQIITGLLFSGAGAWVKIQGDNNKVIGNKFTGWKQTAAVRPSFTDPIASHHAEIAYNEFYNPGAWNFTDNEFRMGIRTDDNNGTAANPAKYFHLDGWIHHNYFHDFPDKPIRTDYGSGQSDAIEIGETQTGYYAGIDSGYYVEYNLITDHLEGTSVGAAIVDFKVGGVVSRYNTFKATYGKMDFRGGSQYGSTMESNYWHDDCVNAGGTYRGRGNRIIGNRQKVLYVGAGMLPCDQLPPAMDSYAATCGNLVVGNIVSSSTVIGYHYSEVVPNEPSNLTTIRDHTGSITIKSSTPEPGGYATNTVDERGDPPGLNYTAAVALTTSQVGPSAISSASSAYRAARGL